MNDAIDRGISEHLRKWHAAIGAGAPRLGWKVAFNVRSIQERLGLPYSLVAGLTRETLVRSGTSHSLSGATAPALEAEVAVWLKADIAPDASEATAASAIERWAPAIEIVDLNRGLDDLEPILADGVFHRAVVLGEPVAAPHGADLGGRTVQVAYGGSRSTPFDALEATGHAPALLQHLARLLGRYGEGLRALDVVILGSMNPLTFAERGKDFSVSIDGLGAVSVSL